MRHWMDGRRRDDAHAQSPAENAPVCRVVRSGMWVAVQPATTMETLMTTTNNPPRDAGRVIRSWRQRVGLTQEGLAQALSVTFSTVSRWENGHVLPSKLAWRAMHQLATERGIPLDAGVADNGNGIFGDD